MKIGRFTKSTLSEWKGKNSCVIEVRGSILRSPYLCNSDIFNSDGPCIEEDEILDYISSHNDSLDAIVMAGGEPLAQKELYPFLKKLKVFKIPILLKTEGTMPDTLDDLAGACMFSRVSLRVWTDPEKYPDFGEEVSSSLDILSKSDVEYEVELLAIPGITDKDVCSGISRKIGANGCMVIRRFDLSKLNDPSVKKINKKEALELYQAAKKYCKKIELKGF